MDRADLAFELIQGRLREALALRDKYTPCGDLHACVRRVRCALGPSYLEGRKNVKAGGGAESSDGQS